jgi:hypothetical protein
MKIQKKKNHATATIRHTKNSIMMRKNKDGIEKFTHKEKANILWDAYKERLRIS